MGLLQKIKRYLPIRSESFYKRCSQMELRLQAFQEETAANHRETLNALASLEQGLQHTISKLGTLQSDFRLFHALATSRQAYFIRETLPFFLQDDTIEEYDTRLQSPGKGPEIPVVFITDSQYLIPAMTAASSLLRHAEEKDFHYTVHIIGCGLTREQIEPYAEISPRVYFHLENKDYTSLTKEHAWVSPAALLKFDIPNLFPEYDKLLYLDSDMLVYENLVPLWKENIESFYAAVVKDLAGMVFEHHHEKMGHKNYFNTGMMLLNLKKMRQDNITERLFEAKKNDPWKHFMDQDVFNQVFQENVLYTSPRYNLMLANLYKFNVSPSMAAHFYSISLKEMKEILNTPAIQHLSNLDKPWFSTTGIDYENWHRENACLNRILERRNSRQHKKENVL